MVKKVNVIDVSAFVNKRDYDSKIKVIKGKMPSITNLGTTAALNDVKNEMPNVSYLVKKNRLWCKNKTFEGKYFTTSNYDKFTNVILDAKTENERLVNKCDIFEFINGSDLDDKIVTLGTKADLKAEQERIAKIQAFDSNYFWGKSHFEDDGTQNHLVFQSIYSHFKRSVILIIFQTGNLKDYLTKVLKLFCLYIVN